jgi:hypothetical protein
MAQPAQIADFQHARFDRALERLHDADPLARIALDAESGIAKGFDGHVELPMPIAAASLPASDQAAAAAVLFLDGFGDVFGIPGWHVLRPRSASPLGASIWFAFDADLGSGRTVTAHVCAEGATVRHVRIEIPEPTRSPLDDEDDVAEVHELARH